MPLEYLPHDIVLRIGHHLNVKDIFSWMLTNRKFYCILPREMYRQTAWLDENHHRWPFYLISAAFYNKTEVFKGILGWTKNVNEANIKLQSVQLAFRKMNQWHHVRHKFWRDEGSQYTSILHIVIRLRREAMVRLLITRGADIAMETFRPLTALHLAASTGHLNIIKMLTEALCRSGTETSLGSYLAKLCQGAETPNTFDHIRSVDLLSFAIQSRDLEIVRFLMNAGAAVSPISVYTAVLKNQIPILSTLLDGSSAVPVEQLIFRKSLLHVRSIGAVEVLLRAIPKLDTFSPIDDMSFLDFIYTHPGFVSYIDLKSFALVLVKYGGRVNANFKNNAFILATHQGHLSVSEAMLKNQPELLYSRSENDNTALHVAMTITKYRTPELRLHSVQKLIELGFDVNALNIEGETPLHTVCHTSVDSQSRSIVECLILSGTDINIRSTRGHNVLVECIDFGNPVLAIPLIDAGIDLSATTCEGNTALHLAAEKGYIDVVRRLLQTDSIDVCAQTVIGNTPLHLAVMKAVHYNSSNQVSYLVLLGLILARQETLCMGVMPDAFSQALQDPENKYLEIIRLLRSTDGIDISLSTRNNQGFTPFEIVLYEYSLYKH